MRRGLVLLLAACAVFGLFAGPAQAAPLPVTGGTCEAFDPGAQPCLIQFVQPGTGNDLHITMANKCSAPVTCIVDVTLTGSFDKVLIDRANQCTNGADCRIIVHPEAAQIRDLQFRDKTFRDANGTIIKDRCDATAVCTKTP